MAEVLEHPSWAIYQADRGQSENGPPIATFITRFDAEHTYNWLRERFNIRFVLTSDDISFHG